MTDENNYGPENEPGQVSNGNGNGEGQFNIRIAGMEPPGGELLPQIQLRGGELAAAADEAADVLIRAGRPVYQRGGMLVTPIWTPTKTANGATIDVAKFHIMTPEKLAYMLTKRTALFLKVTGSGTNKKNVQVDPPERLLRILANVGHWKFAAVAGIINTPTLRPDGSVLAERGYDKATKLHVHWDGTLVLPPIPEQPTIADAQAAKQLLLDLLREFAFISDVDRSVAVACLLTAVLRGAFDLAPMFLFLSHVAGTGKSYLADLVSCVATGRPCPVMGPGKNEEETEKRLGAMLLEGPSIISLDNLTSDLESEMLCRVITQRNIKFRILGKTELPECQWQGLVLANGNNVQLVGDLTRRGLVANMDAQMERPETRPFDFKAVDEVLKDRGRYIVAAMILARAYLLSGATIKCEPLAGFDPWSRFVREPLLWLGMPDPVKSTEEARKQDPKRVAATELIRQWKKELGTTQAYKVPAIIAKAIETDNWQHKHPDFYDALAERASVRGSDELDRKRLGHWLSLLKGQIYSVDGARYRIVAAEEDAARGNLWKLEQVLT